MQIKRGRPKKVKDTSNADKFFEEVSEALSPKTKMEAEVEKRPSKSWGTKDAHATKGSYGTNRIYRHKDGTSCLVTYSGNKNPPEEVHCK
jgi:hypothetical protein